MALIRWQTNAKRHLKQIYDYYKEHASYAVACAMRDAILDSVEMLYAFPLSGKADAELSTDDTQYYYVIAKRGKRTYRIYYIYENDICAILAVWDCSKNPAKRQSSIIPILRKRR